MLPMTTLAKRIAFLLSLFTFHSSFAPCARAQTQATTFYLAITNIPVTGQTNALSTQTTNGLWWNWTTNPANINDIQIPATTNAAATNLLYWLVTNAPPGGWSYRGITNGATVVLTVPGPVTNAWSGSWAAASFGTNGGAAPIVYGVHHFPDGTMLTSATNIPANANTLSVTFPGVLQALWFTNILGPLITERIYCYSDGVHDDTAGMSNYVNAMTAGANGVAGRQAAIYFSPFGTNLLSYPVFITNCASIYGEWHTLIQEGTNNTLVLGSGVQNSFQRPGFRVNDLCFAPGSNGCQAWSCLYIRSNVWDFVESGCVFDPDPVTNTWGAGCVVSEYICNTLIMEKPRFVGNIGNNTNAGPLLTVKGNGSNGTQVQLIGGGVYGWGIPYTVYDENAALKVSGGNYVDGAQTYFNGNYPGFILNGATAAHSHSFIGVYFEQETNQWLIAGTGAVNSIEFFGNYDNQHGAAGYTNTVFGLLSASSSINGLNVFANSIANFGGLWSSTNGFINPVAFLNFSPDGTTNIPAVGTITYDGLKAAVATLGYITATNGNFSGTLSWPAMYATNNGSWNTFFGYGFNNAGSGNSGFGFDALHAVTGNNNTASGWESMLANTSGFDNTASGYDSLWSNVSGYENTASGYQAGYSSTGNLNAYFGMQAGYNQGAGSQNTFGGGLAGFGAFYALNATALSYEALYSAVASTNDTASGAFSGAGETNGAGNLYYGAFAAATTQGPNVYNFGNVGNSLFLLGINALSTNVANTVKVGIAKPSPAHSLDIGGYDGTGQMTNLITGNGMGNAGTTGQTNGFSLLTNLVAASVTEWGGYYPHTVPAGTNYITTTNDHIISINSTTNCTLTLAASTNEIRAILYGGGTNLTVSVSGNGWFFGNGTSAATVTLAATNLWVFNALDTTKTNFGFK